VINEFKYLTVGEEDANWGLFLNVAGSTTIKRESFYPPVQHPSGYHFNWKDGRVLHEYQINYITEGAGVFENKYGKFSVKQGSILFTFPGVWHRYKPLTKTGWIENYIGFEGKIARELFNHPRFTAKQPVLQIGIKEELLDTYLKIFDLVEKEQPGFQQIASGMVMKLLGYIISFDKQKGFAGKRIAKVIDEARFMIRQHVEKEIDLEKMAEQLNIGYSHFRQMFKKYTGISPGQYHLQLRIIRAKELLISTEKSIKEISYDLGFQSIYYFSNMFKKKEGMNPSSFRKGGHTLGR
jgi:AraC-like DNA-binding protein